MISQLMSYRARAIPTMIIVLFMLCVSVASKAQNTETKCPDTLNINSYLTVYGFGYDEIKTTLIRLYKKNSGFKNPFDSFYVHTNNDIVNEAENNRRFINVGETKPITNAEDWEIVIGGKYVYRISDVKVSMQLLRHSMYKCQMKSFRLNGALNQASQITITKPKPAHKEIPHN